MEDRLADELARLRARERASGARDVGARRDYNARARLVDLRQRMEEPLPPDAPELVCAVLERAATLAEPQLERLCGGETPQGEGEGAAPTGKACTMSDKGRCRLAKAGEAADDACEFDGKRCAKKKAAKAKAKKASPPKKKASTVKSEKKETSREETPKVAERQQGWGEWLGQRFQRGGEKKPQQEEAEWRNGCHGKLLGKQVSDLATKRMRKADFEEAYAKLQNNVCFRYDELEDTLARTGGDLSKFATLRFGEGAGGALTFTSQDVRSINEAMRRRSVARNPRACAKAGAEGWGGLTWGDEACVGVRYKASTDVNKDFYDGIVRPFLLALVDGLERNTHATLDRFEEFRKGVPADTAKAFAKESTAEAEEEMANAEKELDEVQGWVEWGKGKAVAGKDWVVENPGIAALGVAGVAAAGAGVYAAPGLAAAAPAALAGYAKDNPYVASLAALGAVAAMGGKTLEWALWIVKKLISALCAILRWALRNPAGTLFMLKISTIVLGELCNYMVQTYFDQIMYWTQGRPPLATSGPESVVLVWHHAATDDGKPGWVAAKIVSVDEHGAHTVRYLDETGGETLTADERARWEAWREAQPAMHGGEAKIEPPKIHYIGSASNAQGTPRAGDILTLWDWRFAESAAEGGTKFAVDLSNVGEWAQVLRSGAPAAFVEALKSGNVMRLFNELVNMFLDFIGTMLNIAPGGPMAKIVAHAKSLVRESLGAMRLEFMRNVASTGVQLWSIWKSAGAAVDFFNAGVRPCYEKAFENRMTTTSCRALQTRDRCGRARRVATLQDVTVTLEFDTREEWEAFRVFLGTQFRQGSAIGTLADQPGGDKYVVATSTGRAGGAAAKPSVDVRVMMRRGDELLPGERVEVFEVERVDDIGVPQARNTPNLVKPTVARVKVNPTPRLLDVIPCQWGGDACAATTAGQVVDDAVETAALMAQAVANIVYGVKGAAAAAATAAVSTSIGAGAFLFKAGVLGAGATAAVTILLPIAILGVTVADERGWFDWARSMWSGNATAKELEALFDAFREGDDALLRRRPGGEAKLKKKKEERRRGREWVAMQAMAAKEPLTFLRRYGKLPMEEWQFLPQEKEHALYERVGKEQVDDGGEGPAAVLAAIKKPGTRDGWRSAAGKVYTYAERALERRKAEEWARQNGFGDDELIKVETRYNWGLGGDQVRPEGSSDPFVTVASAKIYRPDKTEFGWVSAEEFARQKEKPLF